MIALSMQLVTQSAMSLDVLWHEALSEVVAQLHRGGYVVDPDINSESLDEYGFIQQFRVVPGPATLIAARDDRGMGSVGILLIGHKFGLPAERVGKDQSIWDRLETVRSTLEETYFVAAEIFDPEQQD